MGLYKKLIYGLLLLSHNVALAANINAQDVTIGVDGGRYSRSYPMDNLPFIFDTGTIIGKNEPSKFSFLYEHTCTGLDAQVVLPIVGSLNGQDIYKLTEEVGLLVWAGDSHFRNPHGMTGNGWIDVFHNWCSADSQGYSFYVKPVILKRVTAGLINIPAQKVGNIRLRINSGPAHTGKLEFSVTLNSLTLGNNAQSCRLLSPSSMNVALPTISQTSIPNQGDETFAGLARISLQCDPGVTVWATLTDATNTSNSTDILSLTNSSTAQGVGLKIYKNDAMALKFGPDSTQKGNLNQWQLSNGVESNPSVQLNAHYINTNGAITPGTVEGIATITFSYQ